MVRLRELTVHKLQKRYKTQSEAAKAFQFIERKLFYSAYCNHRKYLATNEAGELRQYHFKRTHRPRYLPDHLDYVSAVSDNPFVTNPLDVLQPLKNHLRGNQLFGLSKTSETKALPYIAPDLDRHNQENTDEFLNLCEVTHDELSKLKDFHFFLQVNRENGSAKFFTFHLGLKNIPISLATDTADAILVRIFERTGKEIEVFGSSKNHLCLHPLHPEKSFVTDAGRLGTEQSYYMGMKYRINDCWYTKDELDEMAANTCNRFAFRESLNITEIKKKRISYSRPSTVEFYQAYNRKRSVSKQAALQEIRKYSLLSGEAPKSFTAVPDTSVVSFPQTAPKPSIRPDKPVVAEYSLTAKQMAKIEALQLEPDARRRQHRGCLILANLLKRPPTEVEATEFIREHNLFSGNWENPKRAARIKGIVNYVAEGFDPEKCGSGKPFDFNFDSDRWSKWVDEITSNKFKDIDFRAKSTSYQTPRINPETLETIGDGKEYSRTYNIEETIEAALYAYILDEGFHSSLLNDGGFPEKRAKALFKETKARGCHSFAFEVRKFRRIVAILNQLEIIDCDYVKYPGKSYCYSEGVNYPFKKPQAAIITIKELALKASSLESSAFSKRVRNTFLTSCPFSLRDFVSDSLGSTVVLDQPAAAPVVGNTYRHNTVSVDTSGNSRLRVLKTFRSKPPD